MMLANNRAVFWAWLQTLADGLAAMELPLWVRREMQQEAERKLGDTGGRPVGAESTSTTEQTTDPP